jgi:DNA-binding PadR family transcriptional regulator
MGARVDIDRSERRTFAMRSPVNWALLGLLIERPGYGYDLFQRFKRTFGELIVLSCQAQIYKGLDALEERGLIEPLSSEEALPEELRQPKTRYRARAEAMPDYRDWLITQVTQERQRLELLALLVGALPPRDALVVVDRYEQHLLSERGSAPPALDGASARARRLAEHAKQLETGLALKWTTYARRELEAAIDAQARGRESGQAGASTAQRGHQVALR